MSTARTIWPLSFLQRDKGHQVIFLAEQEIADIAKTGDDSVFEGAHIVILSRINGVITRYDPWEKARSQGTKIVYETDDDLTGEYRDLGQEAKLECAVKWADAVTVSTPHLGEVMGRYGKPVYVLPNLVDVEWYDRARHAKREVDGVTIGLLGTATHFFDWLLVLDALKEIKARFPHAQVVTAGYPAPFMEQVEGTLYFQPVPFQDYPALLAQIDIRLCPIDTGDPFNKSKSGIAALEAAAATRAIKGKRVGGCISIASDCEQYRRCGAILVENTTEAWVDAIASLLSDKGKRLRLSESCHEAVRQFDVPRGNELREQVYQEIVG